MAVTDTYQDRIEIFELFNVIDGDTAEASARVRAYHVGAGDKAHLFEESLAAFEAKLIRTREGWRFSHFAEPLFVILGTQEVFGLANPHETEKIAEN